MPVPADPRGLRAPRVWGPGAGGPGDPGGHERPGWVGPSSLPDAWQARGRGRSGGSQGPRSGSWGGRGRREAPARGWEGRNLSGSAQGAAPARGQGPAAHSTAQSALRGLGGLQHPFPLLGAAPTLTRSIGLGARLVGSRIPTPTGCFICHVPSFRPWALDAGGSLSSPTCEMG